MGSEMCIRDSASVAAAQKADDQERKKMRRCSTASAYKPSKAKSVPNLAPAPVRVSSAGQQSARDVDGEETESPPLCNMCPVPIATENSDDPTRDKDKQVRCGSGAKGVPARAAYSTAAGTNPLPPYNSLGARALHAVKIAPVHHRGRSRPPTGGG